MGLVDFTTNAGITHGTMILKRMHDDLEANQAIAG
jgi:hypothetical protein